MGNRGDLHAPDGSLGRYWRGKRWITCLLHKGGRRVPMDTPGSYYPLFFYDEAVALAAGHRPCAQCRPEALSQYLRAWKLAHGMRCTSWVSLKQVDEACHSARTAGGLERPLATLHEVPDGAFVWMPRIDPRPLLVSYDHLWPWAHSGYAAPLIAEDCSSSCRLLTPAPILDTLREGYRPQLAPELQRVAPAE